MSERITDLAYLQKFTGGQKEKITKYINIFLSTTPPMVANMEDYLLKKDWSGLRAVAHSIKSQLGYMGAQSASSLAKTIEDNSSEQTNLDQIGDQVSQFRNMYNRTCDELKNELKNFS
jgi:HPt (histidine-containing phosphotransfer) domain-containing protein